MLYFNGKPYFVPFIESCSTGGIIEVDSLPTDNIKENAFYLVGGKYYRWEKNGIVGTWVEYVPALVDNDIRGTWVFYDVLSIPNDFYGNEYHFKYSVHDIPNIGDMEYTSLRFYDDGIKYIEYVTADGGDDAVYQEGVGWFGDMQAHKTIVITESPTDETFIAWLKENATKQASGEESVVGTWVFKDDPVPNGYEDVVYNKTYHFDYYTIEYDGNDVPIGVCEFDKMNFEFDGSYFRISYYGNDFSALTAYDSSTHTGWSHDSLKTITITKSPTDERFISWLKENATKQASEPTGVSVAVVNKLPTKNIRQNTLYRMNDNYYKRNETNVLVFNDALSVPEKMYSKAYPLSFSVNVANGPVLTFTEIAFGSMGEVSFYTNGAGIDSAYSDGWKDEKYKTITIDEMPTDDVLLEWLRANAMAEGSWEEYAETTSITPIKSETWKFNDELTNLDKPFANGYEDVACKGYMLYDNIAEPFNFHFTSIRIYPDSVYLRNSDTNGICVYYIDNFTYNFRHATITFTELPDDEVFLAWLKANATKISGGTGGGEGAIAYTAKSVDELPSDAPDGSLALVESDSLVGEWEWKDFQSPLDLSMLQSDIAPPFIEFAYISGVDECSGTTFDGISFELFDESNTFEDYTIVLRDGSEDGTLLYADGCFDDGYYKFKFFTDVEVHAFNAFTAEQFKAFIKTNCNRLSGGYSLYIRKNGEWVYERDAELSGSGSDGAITEIQTPEELDEILANATSSDVGKAYVFVGESNGKYKNNSIYIIREV